MHLAGTITLQRETLLALLMDVCRSVHSHGFRRMFILNAHGGNAPYLDSTITALAEEGIYVAGASWWSFAGDVLKEQLESELGGANHACELETSVLLYLDPALVRLSKAVRELGRAESRWGWRDFRSGAEVSYPITPLTRSRSGVYGDPTLGTAEKGAAIVEHVVGRIAEFLTDFASWSPDPGARHRSRATKREA
jgi:creatinine amidohydrolase